MRWTERDTFPVFLMRGDAIADVVMTEWMGTDDHDEWRLATDSHPVTLTEEVDSAVVELPTGCYVIPMPRMWPGDELMFGTNGPGTTLRPCQRPAGLISREEHSEPTGR